MSLVKDVPAMEETIESTCGAVMVALSTINTKSGDSLAWWPVISRRVDYLVLLSMNS